MHLPQIALLASVCAGAAIAQTPAQAPHSFTNRTLAGEELCPASPNFTSAIGSAAPTRSVEPSAAITGSRGLQDEGEYLIGGGPDFKAVFDTAGMKFTPALGDKAPREMPWQFSLESIERDGATIYRNETGVAPMPVQDGCIARYKRTPNVTEVYEVQVEGVEQSFVFERRLPGHGDLVVRGRVRTELTSQAHNESTQGLAFSSEFGGITVGGVTGIDALGNRTPGSLRFDGEFVELVLPAEFVDRATYPLVLDPLIGTDVRVTPGGNNQIDSDIAYDATNRRYFVVWTLSFAANSKSIYGHELDSNAQPSGNLRMIRTHNICQKPSIGCVNQSNRFLIVWQTKMNVPDANDLEMLTMDPDRGVSATIRLTLTPGNELTPDVANATSTVDDDVLVVWNEAGAGIRGAQINVPVGTANPSLVGTITNLTTNGGDSDPAISKGGGDLDRHAVVWTRQRPTSLGVFAIALSRNGNVLGNELAISDFADIDEDHADVDGDGSSFMVTYECEEGTASTNADIFCRRVRYELATGTLAVDGSSQAVEADANQDEETPAIGFTGTKYVIVWSEESMFSGNNLRGVAVDALDCSRCGAEFSIPGSRDDEVQPAIASQRSAGADRHVAAISYSSADSRGGSDADVHVQRFKGIGSGGAQSTVHAGCGTGGTVTITGAFTFTNDVTINLMGADAGAGLAALHLGSEVSPIAQCESCWILTPFAAVPVPITAGSASLDITPACSPDLIGSSLRCQFVVANTVATPCLGLPVSMSNILDALFAY